MAAEQQEWVAISIWSSTSGAVTLPACQEVCGELGWRSVGTTSLASRWAGGQGRWAIWWLAGTGRGLFCFRVCMFVCVCVSNRPGDVVLGDHLSCSCSSSLSCVVSRTMLSQPDAVTYHTTFPLLFTLCYLILVVLIIVLTVSGTMWFFIIIS